MCYTNALFKNSPPQIQNLHNDWVFPALYILLLKADTANIWTFDFFFFFSIPLFII